jgi:hypothetical protein
MKDIGQVVIGAIFVLISAAGRFNTPHTNRSSTTALRYYVAFFCYLLVGMGLYFTLLGFGPLLEGIKTEAAFFGELRKELSSAPFVALLLTVLLPKIPLLAEGDAWIRERLQKMGAIPYEARRLASQLHRSGFSFSPRLREEVTTRLTSEGFQGDDLLFEESPGLGYVWTRASALMVQIEEWEGDRKFTGFLDQFASEYSSIKESYRRLKPKVRNYFRLSRGTASGGDGRSDDLVLQVRADLTEQSNEILSRLYNFVSRGLLQCGVTYGARASSLAMLGFDLHTVEIKPKLTLNHMMALFGMVAIIVLAVFMSLGIPSGVSFDELLARIVLISVLYSAAAICAVYPKERWSFARREPQSVRPVAFYFAAGALAALASLGISFLFNLVIFRSLPRTWAHSLLTYPWCLSSFSAAFVLAWMTDDTPTSLLTRARLRWVEGLTGAGALAATIFLVFPWLDAVAANHQAMPAHRSPLPVALTMSCAIGFMIGYLIPTWYREAPREEGLVAEARPADRLQSLGTSA